MTWWRDWKCLFSEEKWVKQIPFSVKTLRSLALAVCPSYNIKHIISVANVVRQTHLRYSNLHYNSHSNKTVSKWHLSHVWNSQKHEGGGVVIEEVIYGVHSVDIFPTAHNGLAMFVDVCYYLVWITNVSVWKFCLIATCLEKKSFS